MTRTTTPDQYSQAVKHLWTLRKAKRISAHSFAAVIAYIWAQRHGRDVL